MRRERLRALIFAIASFEVATRERRIGDIFRRIRALHIDQAAQLRQRLGMIVDAHIEKLVEPTDAAMICRAP